LLSSGERRGDLTHNIITFCRLLRAQGLRVTSPKILNAFEAVLSIDLADKEEFRLALRATLISDVEELEIFDRLFDLFWRTAPLDKDNSGGGHGDHADPEGQGEHQEQSVTAGTREETQDGESGDAEEREESVYSALEVLGEKDFSSFRADDMSEVARAIVQLAQKLATRRSRRMRYGPKGSTVDMRRTMRRNLKYGGTVIELARKQPKIKKTRLVLLCDVSRSMDLYSGFLLQFIYALQRVLGRVESFVFSTQLTRVTGYFRTSDIFAALERVSKEVPDWSGGTQIGRSLETFNERFASTLVDGRTIVIILSDGLDTGEPEPIGRAVQALRQRARRVIWLNPLLGHAGYAPLARGMSSALPYVDVFAPAHNLASLQKLGNHLEL
jgi:uncharacterized protein